MNSASEYEQTDCIYTYIVKTFLPSSTGYFYTDLHTLFDRLWSKGIKPNASVFMFKCKGPTEKHTI